MTAGAKIRLNILCTSKIIYLIDALLTLALLAVCRARKISLELYLCILDLMVIISAVCSTACQMIDFRQKALLLNKILIYIEINRLK